MADPSIVFKDADAVLGNYYLTLAGGNRLTTNERPGAFRTTIADLAQNADLPLTGITNMIAQEKVSDYVYKWWERATPLRLGDATAYTDAAMSSECGAGVIASGTRIYVKCAEAVAKNFRPKHVALTSKVTPVDDCVMIVEAVTLNGASSKITCVLLEASTAGGLQSIDKIGVMTNANEQGSFIPDPVMYKKVEHSNYLQILRNPFQLSRTARNTALRTGDPYTDLRRENLLLHGLDWEQAMIWGVASFSDNTPNGEPMTTTQGINARLEDATYGAPQNIYDFYTATAGLTPSITEWDGYSWEAKGDHFMDNALRQMFVYGSTSKVALCGSGAMYGLNRIAKAWGNINMTVGQTSFGLAVTRWVTPFGTLFLRQHPLFTQKPAWNNSVLVIEPASLKIRVMLDTDLFTDEGETKAGLTAYDGKKEEYRAELGLEMHNAEKFFRLDGVGMNNQNYTP